MQNAILGGNENISFFLYRQCKDKSLEDHLFLFGRQSVQNRKTDENLPKNIMTEKSLKFKCWKSKDT